MRRLVMLVLVSLLVAATVGNVVAPSGTSLGSVTTTVAEVDTLPLVLGETIRLVLREGPDVQLVVAPVAPGVRGVHRATFTSTDSAIVSVDPTGKLTASAVGAAIVVASSTRNTAIRRPVLIRVVDLEDAITQVVLDVCPNVDEAAIRGLRPVTRAIRAIHEYHDCQRLITGNAYGPLVGIFYHDDTLERDARYDSVGAVAATIISFDRRAIEGSYPTLGIRPGTNCLVLRRVQQGWEAGILRMRSTQAMAGENRVYGRCDDTLSWKHLPPSQPTLIVSADSTGVNLELVRETPPVARWDWDSRLRLNYIGVKCLDAWCEIGPPKFTSSPTILYREQPLNKGYYDTQFLANADVSAPSSVFGTFLPDTSDVDPPTTAPYPALVTVQWTAKTMYTRSFIKLEDTAPFLPSREFRRYAEHYARSSAIRRPWNPFAMFSRRETVAYELYPLIEPTLNETYAAIWNGDSSVTSRKGLPKLQYRHHPHLTHRHDDVVRWRWRLKDEGTWKKCDPEGCCENVTARTQQ